MFLCCFHLFIQFQKCHVPYISHIHQLHLISVISNILQSFLKSIKVVVFAMTLFSRASAAVHSSQMLYHMYQIIWFMPWLFVLSSKIFSIFFVNSSTKYQKLIYLSCSSSDFSCLILFLKFLSFCLMLSSLCHSVDEVFLIM